MNLDFGEKIYTIYRNDNNGRARYTIMLGKKKLEGEGYDNTFVEIRFKGKPEIENKTKMYLHKGFLTFNNWEDKEGKARTTMYIMCQDFTEVENTPVATKETYKLKADEIELDDEYLPF